MCMYVCIHTCVFSCSCACACMYLYIHVCLVACVHVCVCVYIHACVCVCLVTQSCLTLCDPMDCRLPDTSVLGDSPGKITGVGCHALLHGTFPTQGLNPSLLHCRQILYQLNYQGSPHMYIHTRNGILLSH